MPITGGPKSIQGGFPSYYPCNLTCYTAVSNIAEPFFKVTMEIGAALWYRPASWSLTGSYLDPLEGGTTTINVKEASDYQGFGSPPYERTIANRTSIELTSEVGWYIAIGGFLEGSIPAWSIYSEGNPLDHMSGPDAGNNVLKFGITCQNESGFPIVLLIATDIISQPTSVDPPYVFILELSVFESYDEGVTFVAISTSNVTLTGGGGNKGPDDTNYFPYNQTPTDPGTPYVGTTDPTYDVSSGAQLINPQVP